MLEALKSLFETNAISEEIRAEIESAWNKKVEENKLAVTAELRSEFAEKYEHDKASLTDAVDKMVSERIEAEMAEFAEDKKALAEEKVKYATQIREHSDKLKSFVFEQLKSEINLSNGNLQSFNIDMFSLVLREAFFDEVDQDDGDIKCQKLEIKFHQIDHIDSISCMLSIWPSSRPSSTSL